MLGLDAARDLQQAPRQRRRALGRVLHQLQPLGGAEVVFELVAQQLDVSAQHRQQVVEVVRDARGLEARARLEGDAVAAGWRSQVGRAQLVQCPDRAACGDDLRAPHADLDRRAVTAAKPAGRGVLGLRGVRRRLEHVLQPQQREVLGTVAADRAERAVGQERCVRGHGPDDQRQRRGVVRRLVEHRSGRQG